MNSTIKQASRTKKDTAGKLIILVGPSGAGKSTVARKLKKQGAVVVSSDGIRNEICKDFRDQSKNFEVFNIFYSRIFQNLKKGKTVVADATHITKKALYKTYNVGKKAGAKKIKFLIIDRPLPEKLKTGGWRLNIKKSPNENLIQYHHKISRWISPNKLKEMFPDAIVTKYRSNQILKNVEKSPNQEDNNA